MGSDIATTMKICWLYIPSKYRRDKMPGRAKLKEIVDDEDVLDSIITTSLESKMIGNSVVKDGITEGHLNLFVWTLKVSAKANDDGTNALLKHRDNLGDVADTLVDIEESDIFGWHYRKIEANGKTVFEEEWHKNSVNGHNKPSEDFNKSTEDFIIDEFLPDERIMMTLNQGL